MPHSGVIHGTCNRHENGEHQAIDIAVQWIQTSCDQSWKVSTQDSIAELSLQKIQLNLQTANLLIQTTFINGIMLLAATTTTKALT